MTESTTKEIVAIMSIINKEGSCFCYYDLKRGAQALIDAGIIQKHKEPRKVPVWVRA